MSYNLFTIFLESPDRHAHDHGEHYFSVSYKDVIATVDGEVISLVKLFKRDLVVEGFGVCPKKTLHPHP